jgi:hypothetical protein
LDRSGGSALLKAKGKSQKEKDFAPPGQLNRYALFVSATKFAELDSQATIL